jgi:hypothetical protein
VVERSERAAFQALKDRRSMGGDLLTRSNNIDPWQYGVASSLTDFLIKSDRSAYTKFIQGMKEGLPWDESLKAAYKHGSADLVAAYGRAIGIPDLKP